MSWYTVGMKLTRISNEQSHSHTSVTGTAGDTGLITCDDGEQIWVFRGNRVSFRAFCQLNRFSRKEVVKLTLMYGGDQVQY